MIQLDKKSSYGLSYLGFHILDSFPKNSINKLWDRLPDQVMPIKDLTTTKGWVEKQIIFKAKGGESFIAVGAVFPRYEKVRNQNFTKADYEAVFKEYLGINNVIWLGNGIEGDDTHGHIDDLCRFVNPTTIITVVEDNKEDANYKPLQDNLKRLQQAKLENGEAPKIVTLPMPKRLDFDGIRIPASYANFLILNKCVLVPTFNDSNDRIALNIIAACFPEREIIGISAIDLIWGFGTLHCLSQQIPI